MTRKLNDKVAIVTGASSGIGRDCAIDFAKEGAKVYALARSLDKMDELRQFGIIPIKMDISKEDDIVKVVDEILAKDARIDILVNNAGFGLYGAVEDVKIDDARYQFEVNVFGLMRFTQLLMPAIRKSSDGRIVNISSVGGKVYSPLGGWYYATKHALEALSDCMRIEVKQFGIKVVIIQPGLIKTNFGKPAGKNLLKNEKDSEHYERMQKALLNKMEKIKNISSDVSVTTKLIRKAVIAKNPRIRYYGGTFARSSLWGRKILGDRIFDKIITWIST